MEGKEINISMRAYDFLTEAPNYTTLEKNKTLLDGDERQKAMDAGAVWHNGPKGKETCAIWKGKDSKGQIWYVCNTHRCYKTAKTLAGAIKNFDYVKTTA